MVRAQVGSSRKSIQLPRLRFIHLWIMLIPILALLVSCDKKSPPLPRPYVGAMEANHPWMIFDPTMEQGMVYPCGDKIDLDIVYLVFAMRGGDAMKVNLRTKEISPYHFDIEKLKDVHALTVKYNLGFRYENNTGPLMIEFRGKKEARVVKHMYGDPVPNQPGLLKSEFRTGYYYIIDHRNKLPIEVLRTKLVNSSLSWAGLGTTYTSPDGRWLIFVLYNMPSRTIFFNRIETSPTQFSEGSGEQVIERW
jgi:hypothetical protein